MNDTQIIAMDEDDANTTVIPVLTKEDRRGGTTSVRTEPASKAGEGQLHRPLSSSTAEERFEVLGSWVAAACLSWLICFRLLPWHGVLVYVVVAVAIGLALLTVITSISARRPEVVDRLMRALVHIAALIVITALVSVVGYIFYHGFKPLLHLNTFIDDGTLADPRAPLDRGGVAHAVVGSLIEMGIAVLITLPLGIGTAVYMTEIGGRFAKVVRTIVEAMTALPSIVAGLFIYSVWLLLLGQERSGFAAALALSVMMLPIIARAADVVLRVVPGNLREAGLALGASRWKVVWNVVLPTARPGLATALILGVARGVGETSPVLLTSGASNFFNFDPLQGGAMNSLPLYIFTNVRSGELLLIDRAYGAAAILLGVVLILFVTARIVARPLKGNR